MSPDGTLDTASISEVDIRVVGDEDIPLDPDLEFLSKKDEPLFRYPLTVRDAVQIGIADCFMIAGLHSLIEIKPEAILGSMKDLGDGWVDVRIFEEDGTVRYYRVEKTIVKRKKGELQGHEAIWPHFIEKAFAKCRLDRGYKFLPGLDPKNPKKVAETYVQALSGGSFGEFLAAILGSYSKLESDIHTEGGNTEHRATLDLFVTLSAKRQGKLTIKETAAIERIFGGPLAPDALGNLKQCNFDFLTTHGPINDVPGLGDDDTWRREKLVEFLDLHYGRLLPETKERLVGFIKSGFPGKRGSGLYSQQQKLLFSALQQILAKNFLVGLGTKPNIAKVVAGRQAQTGEAVKAGLAGPHAYSVTGLAQYQEDTSSHLCFIKLRNPWLQTVRQYRWKELGKKLKVLTPESMAQFDSKKFMTMARSIIRDKKYKYDFEAIAGSGDMTEGEFWLELSDLTKRFNKLTVFAEDDSEGLLAKLKKYVDDLNEMPESSRS